MIKSEVTDEMVDEEIETLLEENASYTEITDRAAQEGDTVNVDFTEPLTGKNLKTALRKALIWSWVPATSWMTLRHSWWAQTPERPRSSLSSSRKNMTRPWPARKRNLRLK